MSPICVRERPNSVQCHTQEILLTEAGSYLSAENIIRNLADRMIERKGTDKKIKHQKFDILKLPE